MNIHINVIKKGSSTKPAASVCPWIMDVPPEADQK
jgi:hypothetical protein